MWNQSSPIQPSTIGFIGTDTFSAGCGLTSAIRGRKPSYEIPRMPTLPLRLRDVLHQPVDGVVGVGRVIDRRLVLRAAQGPVHDVVPLGAVLAADVLHDADVAALQDHIDGVVVAVQDRPEVRALGVARELVGVVGRAGQEDRRSFRALRDQDDGVQLDAVAHGNHHLAPGVVEAVVGRLELGRDLARQLHEAGRGDVCQKCEPAHGCPLYMNATRE